MFCHHCGGSVSPGQRYCMTCGTAVVFTPTGAGAFAGSAGGPASNPGFTTAPAERSIGERLRRHLQVLSILWLVFSGLQLLGGLILMLAAGAMFGIMRQAEAPVPGMQFLRPFLTVMAVLVASKGLAGVIAGIGLMKKRSWGRALGLILAFLTLLEFPFGTALAVYTLWLLFSPNADREYRALGAGE